MFVQRADGRCGRRLITSFSPTSSSGRCSLRDKFESNEVGHCMGDKNNKVAKR